MLRKIISVRNVGRFRNSAAAGNPQFSRHTLIQGANGFGKTTLCAVLRSLQTGNPTVILGRRTLGVEEPQAVEILVPDGLTRFDGAAWSASYPHLAIFDGLFVTENVHSGETVEIDHRRNLYRVIIGEEGVRLANEDTSLARQSRAKTGEITAAFTAIQPQIPAGMGLDAFLALPTDPEIDARIAEQERTVEAVRQAQQINDRLPLSEIEIPSLPDGFTSLLGRAIDDIAQDSESRIAKHLAAHGMESEGGNWIAEKLDHADSDTCPFCGQNIEGLALIAAYRAVFSDRYKALCDDIATMRGQIISQFGEGSIGHLNTLAERNRGGVEFWSRYCSFDFSSLSIPDEFSDAFHALGEASDVLLERKSRAPLEPIYPNALFKEVAAVSASAQAKAQEVNVAIRAVNDLIASRKVEAGSTNVQAAERELSHLQATKVRHADPVARLCADYVRMTGEKAAIERHKSKVRAQLTTHTRRVVRPYEERINHYLEIFNANFQITESQHSYPAGIAASTYRLLINDTTVDLGDASTPADLPSFNNTLSSGDRTTLALAFFFTHLEQDQNLAMKTAVFDDPFGSQDAYRRRQTVHEIAKMGQNCAQVIVLSHDATFLKQVWDKAPAAERVALTLADHRAQGTKIIPLDLERACQGRTAADIDGLQAFLVTGAGRHIDLIRKMRAVLETYCWTTYPACFNSDQDWLGDIVRKVREGGDQHPARYLYDELDQINDYTKAHHHGEDVADATPDQIDSQELTGYVGRALRVVNALQA